MGKEKEDFDEELDLDVDADIGADDDLEIDDDDTGGGMLQSTSKRVRMIFSVMASPNRIDILRILNSKGPLTYSELKSLAGFKSKKESGKFAYHLRKLLRQSLVALNKSERRYTITNLGKLVLSLARQIEERSIIESGKMYVRTSHDSIEEFNSHKIIQSLVREGSLPLELSQKITEEVENRIYKFQTTYLTGSLIREMVNNVLLEHGHEEYRNKLARLGMPVFDIQEMFTNVENLQNGVEDLLFTSGKNTLAEYLLTNTLPKDIADAHMSGDIHISNPGLWSVIPDIVFLNLKEFVENGLQLQGKYLGVTRLPQPKTIDDLATLLSTFFTLISKETSQEVVIDELVPVLTKYSKNASEIENMLHKVLTLSSTSINFDKLPTIISFRIPLSADQKTIQAVLSAYKSYVESTPLPKVGLIIDYEKGKISNVSNILSEIISIGG
ncbi:MAG: anaerobic ribonucleoside-triphosphate reductase, partial [Candidatus Nitrosopelagicus sp.]|nr:anaerobic ribonucleoside-triphosphate reductase [Candidatus Nitrosopelagicus sp.]